MRRITKIRQHRGHSVRTLALELGLHPNTLYKFERGERMPQPRNRLTIETYFGLTLEELLEEIGDGRTKATAAPMSHDAAAKSEGIE